MELKSDLKILVVDDMGTMRKIIKKMLVQLGFNNIHEAQDGSEAWPMIKSHLADGVPFEFVISDWNMPGMTGIDLLKNVRATDEIHGLPFLMVTAEAEQSNVVTAVQSGVNNYVVKPFSAQTLKEKINTIFSSKK